MPGWPGVLAMTLVVRDEEDILAANLDYHLSQGVDVIFALDHRSEDRTPKILGEYARSGQVVVSSDDSAGYEQARLVQRLIKLAHEAGADWIIHGDADEFWVPLAGSLRDVFAALPDRYGYLSVPRSDMRPTPDDGRPFHERMVVRSRRSLNLRGGELEPKVAQRPDAGAGVVAGNHALVDPVMEPAPDIGALDILHFPMRTFEQFERKVIKVGTAHEELSNRPEGVSVDQLSLLEMQRGGELRAYYDSLLVQSERGAGAGEVVDPRLRDRARNGPARVAECSWVQNVLHRTWLRAGELADHQERVNAAAVVQLEHEVRTRELAIGDLRWELEKAKAEKQRAFAEREAAVAQAEELSQTLEAIRESRIMRSTARARGVYYRIRGRHGPAR